MEDSPPKPITEPATTKNREGSIGFKGLTDENAKFVNMTLQDEEISPIGAPGHPYNITYA